jgi:CDP-glycerol glycerophosphotransferase
MTFISVIIPFSGVERYLKDCLDSLSEQNLVDEEIILILNGMDEDVDELLDSYDMNIVVKRFESKMNVSKARNEALKIAEGEYVYFIDGDDYVYMDALSRLVDVAKSTNADFINGERINTGYIRQRFSEILEKHAMSKKYPLTKGRLSDEEFSMKLLVSDKTNRFEVLSVLHSLIKRSVISDIRFDESLRYQCDYDFMARVMNRVTSMVGVEDALYAKRISDDFINIPSLNQEMEDEGFLVYAESYKNTYGSINSDLLKETINLKVFRYFYEVYSFKFYSDSNSKWRNEYFDVYADMLQGVSFKKVSFFKKRELQALQARDKGKLRKLLKVRININKLFKMEDMRRIKVAIYYKFYNKKEMKDNQIIFCSFKGDYYSDSPKYLYEYLYENYSDKYEFVWILNDKKVKIPGNPKRVTRFSLKYFKEVARSKYWVINGRQYALLDKRDGQVIVSTWHGTPLKRLGHDIGNVYTMNPYIKHSYFRIANKWDYLISPNRYTTNIMKSAFGYQKDIFESGYPRNDILYNADDEKVSQIKSDLNIPADKKVILYAPTWRDDEYIDAGMMKFQLRLELDKLKEAFSDEYVILIRTHYFIADKIDLSGVEDFAIDVSKYNDIGELYLISDILITDYSSVFFDFANLKRPILFYTYDLEKYETVLRGFYINIHEEVPGPLLKTTDEIIDAIENIDKVNEEYKEKYDQFYERFCSIEDGNASKRIVERIWK